MMTRCKPTISRKEILGAGRRRMGTSCFQHDQHELECVTKSLKSILSYPMGMREGCERDSYARGRENSFLVEDERRETISSGESRPRFIISCGSPDRSCMGDPTYELVRPQHCVFDRGSTWKQKVYELEKCMDDLLQLIRLCPLRDTEHSMSMKRHITEQNTTK